jgi:hypothetical protein
VPAAAQKRASRNKTESAAQSRDHALRARLQRSLLLDRLISEGETELAGKLKICGQPAILECASCNDLVKFATSCKRKWCPCCQRRLAAQRSAELAYIVARMRWPLFVTLTMRNVSAITPSDVRRLRRAFGKLRHRKIWKARTKGGVACIEVTNIGNGWHPHLHCVIDCAWLSVKCQPPPRSFSREDKIARFKLAAQELERIWSKCLGQETSSVKVKRSGSLTIAKEVLKYSVTPEALIESEEPIGDLIRALDSTRLLTTFGTAHGQTVKDIRLEAKRAAAAEWQEFKDAAPPKCQCGCEEWMPWKESVFSKSWQPAEARRLLAEAA